MSASATFSDWLREEVEPKLRVAAQHFSDKDAPSYLIGSAVATGIQPFIYWQRDRASPLPAGQSASHPTTHVADSLSHGILTNKAPVPWTVPLEHQLAKWDIQWDERSKAYVPGGYLQPADWSEANTVARGGGFQWSKEARGWVRN